MVLNEILLARRLSEGLRAPSGAFVVTPMIAPNHQINATAVDLRLGSDFRIVKPIRYTHLNPLWDREEIRRMVARYAEEIHLPPDTAFVLHPHSFVTAGTLEHVAIPANCCGRLEGRSGLGRMGLQVHSTAGFVDSGFSGALTLELQNVGTLPILLFPGVRVAQISLHESYPTTRLYGMGRVSYAGRTGAGGSRAFTDPEYNVLRKRNQLARKQHFCESMPHGKMRSLIRMMNRHTPPPAQELWDFLTGARAVSDAAEPD